MEKRQRSNNTDVLNDYFNQKAQTQPATNGNKPTSNNDVLNDYFNKKKSIGTPDSSDGSDQSDTPVSASESTSQTPDTKPLPTKSDVTPPFKSLTQTPDQLQKNLDAGTFKMPDEPTPPKKVNATDFLVKDITNHSPNIFGEIAKGTEQAMPSKMSAFDKEEISKRVTQNVFGNPDAMQSYTKQRVNRLRSEIQDLETKKLKYVDIDMESGMKNVTNQSAYDATNDNIAKKQQYINQLKSSVAEIANDKILSQQDMSNFNAINHGRKLLTISDPELDQQFKLAEKGGNLPGARQTDLERLGLNAAKTFLDKYPETPNAQQAKQYIQSQESDFETRNVEATAAIVRHKLGQYFYNQNQTLQDKSGAFGYSQDNLRKAINDPALELTPGQKQVAETYVLPNEKKIHGTDIPGSGFIRSFIGGVGKGVVNTIKSTEDLLGLRNESEIAADALSQPENTRFQPVENRSTWSGIKDGMGDFTGQAAVMIAGTKGVGLVGKALEAGATSDSFLGLLSGMAKTGTSAILKNPTTQFLAAGFLNSYDEARQKATELIPEPENAAKRQGYATAMGVINGLGSGIFKETKILKAFSNDISPIVQDITGRLIDNKITAQIAKDEMQSAFMQYAKPFAKEFIKSTGEQSFEMAARDVAGSVAQTVFGGTPFDVAKVGQQALNTALTTALYSPLISGLAAHGKVREGNATNAFYKSAIANMATNPGEYLSHVDNLVANGNITDKQANEKRQLIKSSSRLLDELPESRSIKTKDAEGNDVVIDKKFTPEETTSFIVHGLNSEILQNKIDNTTNPAIQSDLKKQLNRSNEIQKGIYDNSIHVNNDLQEVATDSKDAEKLNVIDSETATPEQLHGTPLEPSAPIIKGAPENISQPIELSKSETTIVNPDEISKPIELNPNGETIFSQNTTQNENQKAENAQTEGQTKDVLNTNAEIKPVDESSQVAAPETFETFKENQLKGEPKTFREYIDQHNGEESTPPKKEDFQSEDEVKSYRVENSQSPTELAAIVADTNNTESDIHKKAADKFEQITGEKLTPETLENVINSAYEKIPEKQKVDESTTTIGEPAVTNSNTENVTIEPTTGESKSDITSGEVGNDNRKTESGGESGNTKSGEDISPEGTGITHAATEETRKEFGLGDSYEKNPKTDIELHAEAEKQIKEGYDTEKLISQLEKGKLPSDVETTILKKYKANLESEISKNPSDENLNKLKRLVKATDFAGSEQGRGLRARQGFEIRDDSLSGYFAQEFDANKGEDLTEKQKAQVLKEHEEITAANKALQEKVAKLEAEAKEKKATENVKKSASTKTKKTHEDFVKDRKKILDDIKNKLSKKDTNTYAVVTPFDPYIRKLISISPDVVKLTASLVHEGITKLSDIVDNIHTTLKDAIPDITKQDVLDLIAGEYNEKKETRSEIAKKIADLKTEAKLINRLSDLENGKIPISAKNKSEVNKEIKKLKEQIKNHDLTKLEDAKKSTKSAIDKLQKKLDIGDYENKKIEPIKLDKEAIALKDKLIKLKLERAERLIKQKYENRTKKEKFKDLAGEVLNIPRSIMSSIDFSAVLNQAVIPSIAHPVIASKAAVEMFKQSISQARFDRWFHDVKESPRYKLMQMSGLYVADPHDIRLNTKEESFMNNLAEKIPIFGKLVKGSERAYVGYLNKMRVDLFNRIADGYEDSGINYEGNEASYKALASFVNNSTGRGNLGPLETAAPILNGLFFAPRMLSSRLNILGVSDIAAGFGLWGSGYYGKMPWALKKTALLDVAKYIGVGLTVMSLVKAATANNDDKDKATVELDPRSSDFGKIKIGNTRWNMWGGFQTLVRYATQLITGQAKSTKDGKIIELNGKGPFGKTRYDVAGAFIRSKFAPIPSVIADVASGRDASGEKTTLSGELENHLSPLFFQDLGQAVEDNGLKSMFSVGIPAVFGVGVQTYGPKNFKGIDYKKDKTYKFLHDKNVNLPEDPQPSKMNDKEYKTFLPAQKKIFKDSWDEVVKNGAMITEDGDPTVNPDKGVQIKEASSLTDDQLSTLMKAISNHATRQAQKDLGIDEDIKERTKEEKHKANNIP